MTDPTSKAKRLRDLAISSNDGNIRYAAMDAADALDALAAERDRLREALRQMPDLVASYEKTRSWADWASLHANVCTSVHAALREGDEDAKPR